MGDRNPMAALVWRFDGRLVVAVHSGSDPSNLEWKGYLRDTITHPNPSALRVFVVSYGGSPSGQQRKELTDTVRVSVPTAYLSNRWIARSLVNTLAWFNPQIRAFDLNGDAAAYEFLGLTEGERLVARKVRTELEKELSVGVLETTEKQDHPHSH